MAIRELDKDNFDRMAERDPFITMLTEEIAWFRATKFDIIGSVIFDKTDKDYNYVILAPDKKRAYRWVAGNVSIGSAEDAEFQLRSRMAAFEAAGKIVDEIYVEDKPKKTAEKKNAVVLTDINEELKKYFAKHPERLYDLSPRKFEELIASIMKDFGFDVELTQATRDGGRDVVAYLRNAVVSFMTFVQCKRYSTKNKIDVGIVREVVGVHKLRNADRSLIVTTSFFTKDAIKEAKLERDLELKDYEKLKEWLQRYKS